MKLRASLGGYALGESLNCFSVELSDSVPRSKLRCREAENASLSEEPNEEPLLKFSIKERFVSSSKLCHFV